MHAGLDQIVAEPAEHLGSDLARGVDRRNQIGKDAVEISHVCGLISFARGALGRNSIDHRPLRRKPPLTSISFGKRIPITTPESDNTEQADLRGGRSPWFARAGQRSRTDITENLECDALVVGGGITGSLIAERLTRQGLDVVIIDRELPGRGSTAASTSMLLWEIDRPLRELTDIYGFERASRAYQASLHSEGRKFRVLRALDRSSSRRRGEVDAGQQPANSPLMWRITAVKVKFR